MKKKERFAGCIIGGAIGDAWGSAYENAALDARPDTFYFGKVEMAAPAWSFTDDTQLTLITLEALLDGDRLTPEKLAHHFLRYHKSRAITGIGASTLKALQGLEAGGHWSQVGRSGEHAAGNGAAMRVAPLAFYKDYTREDIRNFCRITHRNDEAYAGAWAVIVAIRQILDEDWIGEGSLIQCITPHLPDTSVRDRLLALDRIQASHIISEAAKWGTTGYVVHSVPFAILCASQVTSLGVEAMFEQIMQAGGDTDTIASIAGQIAGTLIGEQGLPPRLKEKLTAVPGYQWLHQTLAMAEESLD